MVCAETSKRRARSSTITRPEARAMLRISVWRLDSPATGCTLDRRRLMVRLFERRVNAADRPKRPSAAQVLILVKSAFHRGATGPVRAVRLWRRPDPFGDLERHVSAAECFIAQMRIRDPCVGVARDGHEPNEAKEQRPCGVPVEPVHVTSSRKAVESGQDYRHSVSFR